MAGTLPVRNGSDTLPKPSFILEVQNTVKHRTEPKLLRLGIVCSKKPTLAGLSLKYESNRNRQVHGSAAVEGRYHAGHYEALVQCVTRHSQRFDVGHSIGRFPFPFSQASGYTQ